ncbi:MAG TPA: tetratricopeptide repeat protein [Terriglobales bacterium]|nr:tetratricopeptide repeat protein [Terriglobales bacterium]
MTAKPFRSLLIAVMGLALAESSVLVLVAEAQSAHLSTAATLQILLRDSHGHPLSHATLQLEPQGDTQKLVGQTDTHGQYRFATLRPGSYTLRAELAGYAAASFGPFVVQAGPLKTINLTLALAAASQNNSGSLQFFDEPQFTIAGVTDPTSLGAHGSNATAPAKDDLTREVVSLAGPPASAKPPADEQALRAAAERHHLLADIEEKQGHSLDAAREYEYAARLEPSEANLFDWGAELLLHRASEPAIQVFSEGSRRFPESVRMLLGLGVAWFAQGSNQNAARYLGQASDLEPANPHPYLFLGKIAEVESSPWEGIPQRLARFARLHPEDAQANYYYAVILWRQSQSNGDVGKLTQASALLQKAAQLAPSFAVAYLQLGILQTEQKQYPEAISSYQRAIAADPRLPNAHYRLAQAFMRTGDQAKARAEMQVYNQLAKERAQQAERERSHMQQFVYTLRGQSPASQPH